MSFPELIKSIKSDHNKILAIKLYKGAINIQDLYEILSSINSDSDRLEALIYILSHHSFKLDDEINIKYIIKPFASDIYKLKVISYLVRYSVYTPPFVAFILFSEINSDIYKIKSLDYLKSQVDGKYAGFMIESISSKSSKIIAAKILEDLLSKEDISKLELL